MQSKGVSTFVTTNVSARPDLTLEARGTTSLLAPYQFLSFPFCHMLPLGLWVSELLGNLEYLLPMLGFLFCNFSFLLPNFPHTPARGAVQACFCLPFSPSLIPHCQESCPPSSSTLVEKLVAIWVNKYY